MKKFRILLTLLFGLLLATSLTACAPTLQELKQADNKYLLVERGVFGDKWVYENSQGSRTTMKPCGVPVLERCYKVPRSSMKLRYFPLSFELSEDIRLKGAPWGKTFTCRKGEALWDPELLCAVL